MERILLSLLIVGTFIQLEKLLDKFLELTKEYPLLDLIGKFLGILITGVGMITLLFNVVSLLAKSFKSLGIDTSVKVSVYITIIIALLLLAYFFLKNKKINKSEGGVEYYGQ